MSRLGNKVVRWFYNGTKTVCTISNTGERDEQPVVTGEVKKYVKDVPNKRLARKLAFENAMKTAAENNSIPKEERGQVWNDFRNNINQPVLV